MQTIEEIKKEYISKYVPEGIDIKEAFLDGQYADIVWTWFESKFKEVMPNLSELTKDKRYYSNSMQMEYPTTLIKEFNSQKEMLDYAQEHLKGVPIYSATNGDKWALYKALVPR